MYGDGGQDRGADAYTHAGAFIHALAQHAQHPNTESGLRAAPGNGVLVRNGTSDCYNLENGGKWFDPKTSSTRGVPGPRFVTRSHHTQKIYSEPTGTTPVMQKRYSPGVIFMITTNNTQSYPITVTRSEKPAKPGKT